MRSWALLLLLFGLTGLAGAQEVRVDLAKVTIEKRTGHDWCVLDSRASGTVSASLDRVRAVIEAYDTYPRLFPEIKAARALLTDGAVLLEETVTVSALGITNTNRFTLRIVTNDPDARHWSSTWTQFATDGSIDSLEGGWSLENVGTADKPLVKVSYHTKSAVPVRVVGQDLAIGMFLGGATKAVVEAVFKKALSQ
jgi:hypothetical protein